VTESYLLAVWILLRSCTRVVLVEGLLENSSADAHFFRKSVTGIESLHETTANIVLAMPLNLFRRLAIQNKPDRELYDFGKP
jgi:hypothetical protein